MDRIFRDDRAGLRGQSVNATEVAERAAFDQVIVRAALKIQSGGREVREGAVLK